MSVSAVLDSKTISITGKRQITIPQKFFELLGFGREAECVLRDGEIALRTVRDGDAGAFDEQILADLIDQGLEGQELLDAFKRARAQVRPAVCRMLDEADRAARHPDEYAGYDDVFGVGEDA